MYLNVIHFWSQVNRADRDAKLSNSSENRIILIYIYSSLLPLNKIFYILFIFGILSRA